MQTDIQNPEKIDQKEPWQLLSEVIHKWIVMSQHQKVLDDYEKLRSNTQ